MSSKEEVVGVIEKLLGEIEQAVESMPEERWSKGVNDGGWNARELLCHIASTSGVAGLALAMAQMPSAPGLGAGFDNDAFNAQQLAMRKDKSPAELVGEVRSRFERDIAAVRKATDDVIRKHYKAPWETEGELGDVIVESLNGHLGMHLAELRAATR